MDGKEYVEYGSGLRSVILGHAQPDVVAAVRQAAGDGTNFARPSLLELEAARSFLEAVPTMDMVKFAKNGSDVTTAAVRLARAATGRDLVAVCRDQPFFSTDDWFIGTTVMSAGIPRAVRDLTQSFPYGDRRALDELLERHGHQLAALVLEVESTGCTPAPGYLQYVLEAAVRHGVLVIADEMITGFRRSLHGAHALYGIVPDLVTFGKAIGNGFAVSALAGRRDLMEMGGLRTERDRVFLLSTTHGAETTGLAALRATIAVHREQDVAARLEERGAALRHALLPIIAEAGMSEHVLLKGHDANLVFATLDAEGQPSQEYRTLFMRQLLLNGVLAPSFVVSAALTDDDIARTGDAVRAALAVYAIALETCDPLPFLGGPSVKPVFRARA